MHAIMRTNSFWLRDAGDAGDESVIFPTMSRVNHSCLPTCFTQFSSDNKAVSLRRMCWHCCIPLDTACLDACPRDVPLGRVDGVS
jgi:hypothetical protein